jgi:hypothetical protein
MIPNDPIGVVRHLPAHRAGCGHVQRQVIPPDCKML